MESIPLWITGIAAFGTAILSGLGLGSAGLFVLYLTLIAGLADLIFCRKIQPGAMEFELIILLLELQKTELDRFILFHERTFRLNFDTLQPELIISEIRG